jgi:hypothetical protein
MLEVATSIDVERVAKTSEPARVVLLGTVERVPMEKGPKRWLGTGIVVDDGEVVWLSYGAPPAGWEPLVGSFVRVEGTLAMTLSTTEQSLIAPHLLTPGAPTALKRELANLVDKPVRLVGTAENAKGGAVLLVGDTPVYVAKRSAWSAAELHHRVSLGGQLVRAKFLPEATVNAKGEVSQGVAPGSSQYVLRDATTPTVF